MPELPEIERYRTAAEAVLWRPIVRVDSPDDWFLKGGTTGAALEAALLGRTFVSARRIGKLLLLDVDGGPTVGVRFGMTGTLVVDGDAAIDHLRYAPAGGNAAWDRWSVGLEGGGAMVVRDPRRLGGVTLDPDASRLGPDALTISVPELAAALTGSTTALKARLLDQSRVAGIGNLIVDEVLWRAGLSPLRPAGSLTAAEVRRLHRHLGSTLGQLIERGGSHLGDLVDERHRDGRCPRDGAALTRSVVGGRTTWWCPRHQR
ncbi:MAG: Fpg/Nei family DNA glycosylase [Acidimicrobiales bacterium]